MCGIKSDLQVTNSCIFLQFAHMKSALKFWNPSLKKKRRKIRPIWRKHSADCHCCTFRKNVEKIHADPYKLCQFHSQAWPSGVLGWQLPIIFKAHALHGINQSRALVNGPASSLKVPWNWSKVWPAVWPAIHGTWIALTLNCLRYVLWSSPSAHCDHLWSWSCHQSEGSGVFFNKPCGEKVTPCLFDLNVQRPNTYYPKNPDPSKMAILRTPKNTPA